VKSLLIIINPVSGKGDSTTLIPKLLQYYQSKGYLVSIYLTDGKNDKERIPKCAKLHNFIICIGGDGTLHNTIVLLNSIAWKGKLGYIPRGSANDISRNLIRMGSDESKADAYELDLEEWMHRTTKEQFIGIDIGKLNEKFFVYVAAFGLFTDVTYTVSKENKNRYGYLAYVLDGLRSLSNFKTYHVSIKTEKISIEDDFIAGIISNSFSIGGFKNPMSVKTALNDGILECIFIKKPIGLIEINSLVASLLNGSTDDKNVVSFQCTQASITSEPIDWTLDGEYGGKTETAEISVIPNAVSIAI